MVRSMTGFGRASKEINGLNITVEIKSVNHRYFEFSSRLQREYMFLDEKLKSLCQQSISRGKVEVFVSIEDNTLNSTKVEINKEYADTYIEALKKLANEYNLRDDISVSSFIGDKDMFKITKAEIDDEIIINSVVSVASDAISKFIAMRSVEGERLLNDINSRTEFILEKISFIEERSPETVKLYRNKLEQKIRDLLDDKQIDEQRLLTETAIFADKIAVAEETVRLRSHIKQFSDLLSNKDAVGRKLDFIVQEMNREANTIGSKAQDIEIAHTVVDIKSEIEKIREQIQNIE